MKKLFVACTVTAVLAGLAGVVVAQQTRREEVRSSGAAEDARPNSPNVPDVYAINGQFDRVVILRFKYQTDLLAGMEKMVKEQHIKNAVILSAIGSVRNYQVHAVSNRTFPSKDTFTTDPTAPADVIGPGEYREGVRRTSGTRHQRLHVCDRDDGRAGRRRGHQPHRRQDQSLK